MQGCCQPFKSPKICRFWLFRFIWLLEKKGYIQRGGFWDISRKNAKSPLLACCQKRTFTCFSL